MNAKQTTVLVDNEGPLRTITLNRPDRLNSFNEAMHLEFRAALEAARDDAGCRAVLVTGGGRAFCAGQDLGERDPSMADLPDLGDTLRRFFNPNIKLIAEMPKPVIAAVNGAAAGAGANIALACDIVVAARGARFIQAFARIGLVPDCGGTWLLPRLAGRARATGMAMLAEPIDAETALQWGLVWKVVDDDVLERTAREIALGLANGPTLALALIKRAMAASARNGLDEQLALEAELQSAAGASLDYREGVTAFLEKRKPGFTGK